jgi:hypothetical protein
MTPKAVPLEEFTPLSPQDVARLVGPPGSDEAFAYWLLAALNTPDEYAQTPELKQRLNANREKAFAMIARAALDHDEAFFARWARGRKALKAIDLRTSLDPKLFLLLAYKMGGYKTSQAEVIRAAIILLAWAKIYEPSPERKLTRAQFEEEIDNLGLRGIGWKAYIRKLGLTFALKAKRGRKPGWRNVR